MLHFTSWRFSTNVVRQREYSENGKIMNHLSRHREICDVPWRLSCSRFVVEEGIVRANKTNDG
jgi:hypothetical protein